ncbi:Trafficking protein particle complex subunit 4 [Anthophora plagiata]
MVIYGVYIVSKSGGLIFNHDHNVPRIENEKPFTFPLDIKLSYENKKVVVSFGQKDGINVGHVLTTVNGSPVVGRELENASMFYPLFAIASQLSPEPRCSGIEILEADTFRLHCYQTLTGIKFIVVAEPTQSGIEILLKRVYELYADYALKNPFYSLEMPIRCELFETNLQNLLENIEKSGASGV